MEPTPAEKLNALLDCLYTGTANELRQQIEEVVADSFSRGYDAGLHEGLSQSTVPDEAYIHKGEAKGIAWAYHAIKGNKVQDMSNHPYVNRSIMADLLEHGRTGRLPEV